MRLREKVFRTVLAVIILIGNTKITPAAAADTAVFAGFDNQNISMSAANWDLVSCHISDSSLIMDANSTSASFVVDVSSIASSIDLGGLEIDFSANAYIAEETAEELDSASIGIGFGTSSGAPSSSSNLDRGTDNPGSTVSLTSTASIPTGTRYLFIQPSSTGQGTSNTVVFSGFSLIIHDSQNPSLTYSLSTEGWTNSDVEVTLSSSDADSGIEGIYDSTDAKVSDTTSYSFTATDNGSWSFTTKDYAGKSSDTLSFTVSNIDRISPSVPELTAVTSEWSKEPVSFTISEVTAGTGEAPVTRQYRLNSNDWQTYSEPALVSVEGESALEARTIDAAGNASEAVSTTVKVDTSLPEIQLTSTPHPLPTGGATITATVSDSISGIYETKYAAGTQTASFFDSDGTIFTGTSIDVVLGGVYTIFARDNAGNTQVGEVTVNTYPTVDSISDQDIAEDSTNSITFAVSDGETGAGDLSVVVAAENSTLFPSISSVNSNGSVSISLAPAENLNGSTVVNVTVQDVGKLVSTTKFNVIVDPVNDAPAAAADTASTTEDTAKTIDVLANDSDVDLDNEGDTLTIVSTSGVDNGKVNLLNEGTSLEFVPATDWNGEEIFTYTIQDKSGTTASANVTVVVSKVNDAPVISAVEDQTINEDNGTGVLAFTVTDADGDTLNVTAASSDESIIPNGNITLTKGDSGNYTILVSPAENANTVSNGVVTITITAGDGEKESSESFTVTVNAVNDAPVVVADTATTNEDEAVEVNVLENDSDIEKEALTVTAVGTAQHGSVSITGSGQTVTYTPQSNYNGTDSFTYTVSDASDAASIGTVNITVTSINDAPVAKTDSVSLNEDIVTTIDVLSNDTDVDLSTNPTTESLTISSVGTPSHGTAEIVDNKVVYTPVLNYNGSDSFTYTMQDASASQKTATVNLTIKAVNDYPVFTNLKSEYTVNEDESIAFHFDISDVETATESLMLQVVSQDQTKVSDDYLVLGGLGDSDTDTTLTITPNDNENGNVTIKLTLGDGFVTSTVSFTLVITPVNDDPVAVSDTYHFTEDNSIPIDMDDLVSNDTDIDNDTLSFVQLVEDSLTAGTLQVVDADLHTYTYTPPVNFDDTASFKYIMTDDTVQKTGTVYLVAQAVNDSPILTMDTENVSSFNEDTQAVLGFTISDYETAASLLAVQAGSSNSDIVAPDDIAISRDTSGDCSLTITPGSNANGSVTITLSVSDGAILVDQDIELTINEVQDEPVASSDSINVKMGGTATFSPMDNDYDVDGDTLSISSLTTTDMIGSVVNNGDGTLTYTAPANSSGSDSFSYTISDGKGNTASTSVSINITGANTAPQITDIANQYLYEDNATSALAFTVSDADTGSTLTVSAAADNTTLFPDGSMVITENPAGSGSYTAVLTPAANQSGSAAITLTVKDEEDASDTATFSVTVYPVNDLPVAVDDNVSTDEDTSLAITSASLLSNDTDADTGTTLQITEVTDPSHGRLTFSSDTYTYAPDSNYNGADSFTYTITDGETTDTGSVNITVDSVNDTPVTYSNWLTVAATLGASINYDIRSNDYDIETTDANLSVTIVTQPSYGAVVVESDGTVTYTRDSVNYSSDWKDSFTYTVQDDYSPAATSNTSTVYIDDYWGPSIYSDPQWASMNEDNSVNITLPIHDGYGSGYTVSFPSATFGSVTDSDTTDTAITYTPNANAYGSETITYTITSNYTGNPSSEGTLYITIYPINDDPVISPALSDVSTSEDTPSNTIHVDISDVETAAGELIFTASAADANLVLDSGINISRTAGSIDLVITPIANQSGSTTITLLASDEVAQTTQSFLFTVTAVNDAPVAEDQSITINEDTPTTLTLISPNAEVDSGDSLVLTITDTPDHGTATINTSDQTVTYTPTVNYSGTDTFIYQLDDGEATDTATVTITINPVNDPPVISNLTYTNTTQEDTPATVTFTVSDVDTAQSSLELTVTQANTTLFPIGSIVVSGETESKTAVLTPAANLYGSSIQTVKVVDGSYTVQQDFNLVVNSVNDIPVAAADTATTNEDTSVTFNVLSNDSDVETASLTVVSFVSPSHGTVTNNRNGTLTYKPSQNWYGTDSFTYTIADANNGQSSASVTVTVNPVNDAPTAVTDSVTIDEDTPVTLNLLTNDSDIEGSTLTLSAVNTPNKGAFIDNEDGSITYTPDADQTGLDSFTYTVSDGELTSTGTVKILITAINDAPRLSSSVDRPWTMNEDTPKSFPINIVDPETASDNLVIKISSSVQSLVPDTSITLTGSGENKYILLTPNLNQFGSLVLTITANDGVNTTVVEYAVDIISVNDLPTISSVADQTLSEDTPSSKLSLTVTDIETEAASLSVSAASDNTTLIPVENIVITNPGTSSRTVQITPAANKVGSAIITLTVLDADGGTSEETLTVTVSSVNDAPVASNDTGTVNEDGSVSLSVLGNDSDADLSNEGDDLTLVSTSGVDNGTATIATDKKSLSFTPTANWNGTETFSYIMQDSAGVTATASVTVTVTPVNDAPVAANDTASGNEDSKVTMNVLSNDTDIDTSHEGDTLSINSIDGVDNGAVSIAANILTFTPSANWYGTEVFNYTLQDAAGVTSTASVTVTINSVNDAPTISDIANQTITEDSSTGAISFTISDIEDAASSLTLSATTSSGTIIPLSGIVFGGSDGARTVSITPTANKNTYTNSPVTIKVTVTDSGSLKASDTLSVSITKVNDAPTAVNDSLEISEDITTNILVLANDVDVDLSNEGDSLIILSTDSVDNGTVTLSSDKKSLNFKPTSNWSGTETFNYTIQDNESVQSTASVTVVVNPANDSPVAVEDAATVAEDGEVGISVLENDTDIDISREGDTLTILSTAGVDNGTVTISSDKLSLTYKPNANWVGVETFTYTVRDTSNAQSTAEVTVTVTASNDAPSAVDDTLTCAEDEHASLNVLANDTDVDLLYEGDDLIILSFSGVQHGTAVIASGSKSISYVPNENWYGTEEIDYTLEDKNHVESSATIFLTVNAANDAPIAVSDAGSITEDSNITLSVLENDTDIDLSREGDELTIVSTTGVDHGLASISSDKKTLTFTPNSNWNGTETFSYTIKDKANAQSTASVTVEVSAVNDLPAAQNDNASTNEDQSILVNLTDNDIDVDLDYEGDKLSIASTGEAENGVISISSDRTSVLFTPDLNWSGVDTFEYIMQDQNGKTSSAEVTISVAAVNDSPVAVFDAATGYEDSSVTVYGLSNDTDIDTGDSLTIKSVSGVDNGEVAIAADKKSLVFTPASNWNGTETFSYTIQDSAGAEASANMTIVVGAVNDAPVAADDSASIDEDASVTINVLENDTDVDLSREGDSLTVEKTAGVENGTASLSNGNKSILFTPNANWNGTEIFTYVVKDAGGLQSIGTVTVIVAAKEDSSEAVADNSSCSEDGSVVISVLENDIDADLSIEGDNLNIQSVSTVSHGTVVISSNKQQLTYTPSANWNGTETFTYTMQDSALAASSAMVTVTVTPVNDAPTAVNDVISTNEDIAVQINVLVNDLDPDLALDGDNPIITGFSGVDQGTVTLAGNAKSLTFTPSTNWSGEETFTYTMEDKGHLSSSASITVTVLAVNDTPFVSNVTDQTINEDTSSQSLSFTIVDVDSLVSNVTLTVSSSNTDVIPLSGIVLSGSGDSRTVRITPAQNKNTSGKSPVVITLNASDGNTTGSETFTVTVKPVNDAPSAMADTLTMAEDATKTLDVLSNDTDVDLSIEGDTLSVAGVSEVDNATVTIVNSGKTLQIVPDADWYGEEVFTYTLRDAGGLQSSASVTLTVTDVEDEDSFSFLSLDSFYVTSPYAGDRFKDGNTIPVSWTSVSTPGAAYTLEFYDGSSWSTLANGLTETSFNHQLSNTKLHTNSAWYRVTAVLDSGYSVEAQSELFTIDNLPPQNVQVKLETSDGLAYTSGSWTHLPVTVTASGGWDLTGIKLMLTDGSTVLGTNPTSVSAQISAIGEHTIKVYAIDPLKNQAIIGVYSVKIDTAPPASPVITSISRTEGKTGGSINFHFLEDPGLSGNSILVLPDGSEVQITGDYTWNAVEDGEYTFITIDLAGNRRIMMIAVTGGEVASVKETTDTNSVQALVNSASSDMEAAQQKAEKAGAGGAGVFRTKGIKSKEIEAACGLLGFFLLLLLFWPNVKIVYTYHEKDGKKRQVKRWKRVFSPQDDALKVKVKDADAYEITLSRWLTRSLRGGSLTIEPEQKSLQMSSIEIPDDAKDRFKTMF